MSTENVLVPDLGGADSVEVIEIAVAVGDSVEVEQSLVVLESDKATMDVPSSHAGVVKSILVKEGDTVGEGSAIVELELSGEAAAEPAAAPAPEAPAPEPEPQVAEQPASAPAAASEPQLVTVPDIGSDGQVDIIEMSVAVGDTVEEGDTLMVLESDKATMDVPAPFSGEVTELKVAEGGKVATGDAIAMMKASGDAPVPAAAPAESKPTAPAPQAAPAPATPAPAAAPAPQVTAAPSATVHAGPAVRHLARELGVDLSKVAATGPRGRILKDDVHAYVKTAVKTAESGAATGGGAAIPQVPEVDFSQFGEVELVKLAKIAKVTAANMQRSWLNVPHVTQFDDADITELEAFRKSMKAEAEKRGTKLTPVPFLLKAVAKALELNPAFNRSLHADGEHIVQKHYIHVGMAVDTPRGLVVPVIRDVDKKGIWELTEEVMAMAVKARDGKLKPAEMQGGCFTISSLGAIGGKGFTPIVNTPEVGILGISKAEIKPVWNGSEFTPRNMLPLCLSYDHRAINGGDAGRFMTTLVSLIGDIRRLVL
ncbi:dihydrolipoyllysine-residue acetyltransferase [bacterium SCSIO 12696]|nr:dihydrolipoyllysine-residue acetyltransferase [bacterium SCSIO 12696]